MRVSGVLALLAFCTACSAPPPPTETAPPTDPAATDAPQVAPADPLVAGAPAPAASVPAPRPQASSRPAPTPAPAPAAPAAGPTPVLREVTVPAGTTLDLELTTSVASDSSAVEDSVRARVTRAVTIDGRTVIPVGSELVGTVTEAEQSGRVRGRARVAFRFASLRASGERYDIQTDAVVREAAATRGEDIKKVGIGAGVGAAIGGILGGGSGAAKGAAIGGAAGTGAVLATRGEEVRLAVGTPIDARLSIPLRVYVR